ncbi:MAG: branched-chain amino acid ABC transporter permease [Nitriliruptorales bacterium]|nr:branched-chain amino acid ABC transporter permease [Nitriliruptorales bacterium]
MDWDVILRIGLTALIGREVILFALAAIGLNVHFGYTGLLNFGQVAFAAVGAYGIAIAVATFGLSMWIGVALGLLAAVVLALLLGIPTLRLRADYLAIVTIAASEIIRFTLRSVSAREVTGGSFGLTQFARDFYGVNPFPPGRYGTGFLQFSERDFWLLMVGWGLVALGTFVLFLLMRSPWGRVVKSVREDEDAARSLGKNVYSFKMQSLIFGGILGAFAGFIQAVGTQSVQPDFFATPITFFAYVALIAGGTATLLGPIVGAMIFWSLLALTDSLLRQAISAGYIPTEIMSGTQIGQVRFMLVGLGLMLLMIYRPQGIFGDRREMAFDVR